MGGKMLFGPDNTLYVTVGDRDRLCCTGTEDNSLRMKAQSLSSDAGKTLRLHDDGSITEGQSVRRPRGREAGDLHVRAPQRVYGLAFNPETRRAYGSRDGPMGGDEVNILLPGHN